MSLVEAFFSHFWLHFHSYIQFWLVFFSQFLTFFPDLSLECACIPVFTFILFIFVSVILDVFSQKCTDCVYVYLCFYSSRFTRSVTFAFIILFSRTLPYLEITFSIVTDKKKLLENYLKGQWYLYQCYFFCFLVKSFERELLIVG